MAIRNWMRRSPLVAFFVIAFSITWFCQILGLLLAQRNALSLINEDNLLHFFALLSLRLAPGEASAYLVYTLGAGPLVAALLVTWATGGRGGIEELWGRIKKWRVEPRWYLIVFLLPVALALISLTAGVLVGGLRPSSYSPLLPLAYFIPFFLYMLVFTGLAEEPGWRGFALPHLQSRYSAVKSSWILGVLWGVWHFPSIIYYNLATGVPTLALLPILIGLVLGIVGWTIVNTCVYNSTESVFLMIVLHGLYGTVNSYMVLSSQNALAQTLSGILPWALAIILLRVYGGEHLAAKPRPRAETARQLAGTSAR
ncbi:MAG: CPBP family intramembrane metalloprotease [Actinomycetota bacterium]|nr:CPBP family intramembrane metalloprotease [Actinomycetota bacterium]